jgi:hypothetical protein
MRTAILVTASLTAMPAAAQNAPATCRVAAPPSQPVNSEDYNPGFGAAVGLNDDFHDDFIDPLDRPGAVIGDLSRQAAQDDDAGGVHLLRDFVGLHCAAE